MTAITTTTHEYKRPSRNDLASLKGPRLFALLIGIDKYDSYQEITTNGATDTSTLVPSNSAPFKNLRSAVADAQNFRQYLTDDLGVPQERITFLRDEQATRSGIITAFQNLSDKNNDIQHGDSIIIFYAGHGAQLPLPPQLQVLGRSNYTELIIPHDFNKCPGSEEHMAIPDYTMAALLKKIAKNKGDNITVIFDTCRGIYDPSRIGINTPRSAHSAADSSQAQIDPALYFVSDRLDKEIWGNEGPDAVFPQLHHSKTPYVLLSACPLSGVAGETKDGGRFTTALLTFLRGVGPRTLSCSQISSRLRNVKRLRTIDQIPQCEGAHSTDCFIFHGYIPKLYEENRFSVSLKPYLNSNSKGAQKEFLRLTLNAGSDHGISENDEVTVYGPQFGSDGQRRPIGILIVDHADPISSVLRAPDLSFTLPSESDPAPARLTKLGQPDTPSTERSPRTRIGRGSKSK